VRDVGSSRLASCSSTPIGLSTCGWSTSSTTTSSGFRGSSKSFPHLRKHALRGAIDDALRQIEADPHLAVPAYHFDTGSVSLLLPLRLMHAGIVDLALVVGPFGENRYAAWSVCPLEWAYRAARLIKSPSADWIGAPRHSEPAGTLAVAGSDGGDPTA
jgi:hypothetical protein